MPPNDMGSREMTTAEILPPEIPATVKAYWTDASVKAGVDALLAIKSSTLPQDLRLEEFGDYYAARAAAELTRFDRASSLYDIWRSIWGHAIGRDWVPASHDAMFYNELSITPEDCWNDECFCVYHSRGKLNLSTGVGFTDKWIEIVFSVDDDTGPLLRTLDTFEWRDEDHADWPGWLALKLKKNPWDESLSWTVLRSAAEQAVAAANKIAVQR